MISPKPPKLPSCKFTYTPTNKQKDPDETNSITTHRSSHMSSHSGTSSQTHLKRMNQIQPKSKIKIPNSHSQKSQSKQKRPQLVLVADQQLLVLQTMKIYSQTQSSQNISFKQIKPTFNWNKVGLLCGMGVSKLGVAGCLCGDPCPWKKEWTKNHHQNDLAAYQKLLLQKPKQQNRLQIQKDVLRTHSQCPSFSHQGSFIGILRQLLICYSIYDIELGYVQGINMIAGILLYHIKNAEQTFWALVEMMQYQQLRMIYLNNMKQLQVHSKKIQHLISAKINDLYQHMQGLGIDCRCFLNGWIISLMSNAIPLQEMHLVVTKFKLQGWAYMYRLIIACLCFLKEYLMMCQDQSQFLINLSTKSCRQLGVEWYDIITAADHPLL